MHQVCYILCMSTQLYSSTFLIDDLNFVVYVVVASPCKLGLQLLTIMLEFELCYIHTLVNVELIAVFGH